MGIVAAQAPTWSETVLFDFANYSSKGANPGAGVVRDSAGNLYGTTISGGSASEGAGVVFKVDTSGQERVLYTFTGGPDGGSPYAGVIRDSSGNFYGTTAYGGTAGPYGPAGVVYKLDTAGHQTVLYSFTGGADGSNPFAGVIRDSSGNLYGTAQQGGGTSGAGVVFELDTAGQETVLYSFTGGADGGYPTAGLIRDSAGNLYGTTLGGGTAGAGVVFKLDRAGQETVLYSFTGGADGGSPTAGVIRDSAGNLYGTTQDGGITTGVCSTYYYWSPGCGVVFKLDGTGNETVLYAFTGLADGAFPYAGVIRDGAGYLFGTAYGGGITGTCGTGGCGVVYKLDMTGNETVLHSFTGVPDGAFPEAGVVADPAGNLYGTTYNGGVSLSHGAVYKLDPAGQETVYAFGGPPRGGNPFFDGVIRDAAGDLYGATLWGGTADEGVVYKLNAAGQETVLHSFTGGADGGSPRGSVIRDSAGNLYGVTDSGGTANAGVVYKVNTAGQETVLYSFTGGADGGSPIDGPILDSAGNLYGTTYSGGTAGYGVVYKLNVAGQETVLHSFTFGADGGYPSGGVIRDSAGNLYGTASFGGTSGAGVVYKVNAAGQQTVLYNFTGGADGSLPKSGVVFDPAGNLYGTTYFGGTSNAGVVYKLAPSGQETVLCNFAGYTGTDGGYPYTGVIRDSAGNLYGATPYGGAAGNGVVYEVDPTGNETVLYTFTGGADGGEPFEGSLVRDSAGNLYGTTMFGGKNSGGVVFELTPQ
jgi:uncharacterized repeat protein (TIGR03803 family)